MCFVPTLPLAADPDLGGDTALDFLEVTSDATPAPAPAIGGTGGDIAAGDGQTVDERGILCPTTTR